jgi:predicted dehydrogenase
VRLARITTLESPLEQYVAHYPLVRGAIDPELAATLAADDASRVDAAVGDLEPEIKLFYRAVLLDSMIHELNAVRGLLGEPDVLVSADVWGGPAGITTTLRFGNTQAVFSWVDLPGIARYEQELAFFGAESRATLTFPSPFLRSMPTRLVMESGTLETADSWRTERTMSFDEAFRRELVELHACITEQREPRTPGDDALRDVALCGAIARSADDRRPRPRPSDP